MVAFMKLLRLELEPFPLDASHLLSAARQFSTTVMGDAAPATGADRRNCCPSVVG